MATRSQFASIKTCGCRFTGNSLWQITAHDCLANHVSQERKQPFHVSCQIKIAIHSWQKYPTPPHIWQLVSSQNTTRVWQQSFLFKTIKYHSRSLRIVKHHSTGWPNLLRTCKLCNSALGLLGNSYQQSTFTFIFTCLTSVRLNSTHYVEWCWIEMLNLFGCGLGPSVPFLAFLVALIGALWCRKLKVYMLWFNFIPGSIFIFVYGNVW